MATNDLDENLGRDPDSPGYVIAIPSLLVLLTSNSTAF
jgi:hypothetical protein